MQGHLLTASLHLCEQQDGRCRAHQRSAGAHRCRCRSQRAASRPPPHLTWRAQWHGPFRAHCTQVSAPWCSLTRLLQRSWHCNAQSDELNFALHTSEPPPCLKAMLLLEVSVLGKHSLLYADLQQSMTYSTDRSGCEGATGNVGCSELRWQGAAHCFETVCSSSSSRKRPRKPLAPVSSATSVSHGSACAEGAERALCRSSSDRKRSSLRSSALMTALFPPWMSLKEILEPAVPLHTQLGTSPYRSVLYEGRSVMLL